VLIDLIDLLHLLPAQQAELQRPDVFLHLGEAPETGNGDGAGCLGIVHLSPAVRVAFKGPRAAHWPTTRPQRAYFEIAAAQTSFDHIASRFYEM
jgi:hypothetical protein